MNIPENIIAFLSNIKNVSIGYNQINFLKPSEIEAGQIGYSIDDAGHSLITDKEGAWEEGWLVIGNDRLGDPVFIDSLSGDETVMIAAAGDESDEEWDPIFIADTLESFRGLIDALHALSEGRSDAASIKNNPLTIQEKQAFIKKITKENPDADSWYWEDFVEL